MNSLRQKWDQLAAERHHPWFLRGVKKIPYSELKSRVESNDLKFMTEFAESIYSGDAYIVESTFDPDFLIHMRESIHNQSKETAPRSGKVLDGCQNYHEVMENPQGRPGGYMAIDHSHYFFPWNKDPLNVIDSVRSQWRVFKRLSGLSAHEYEGNVPSDGVVDRIQVIHYPTGIGRITTHSDPFKNQKMIVGAMMTTPGKDYQSGGFYMVNADKKRVNFESEIPLGSTVVAFPAIYHGVDVIDPGKPVDWSLSSGRWYLALYSPDSHHLPHRETAFSPKEDL